ncbi:MAG: hypothetical protein H2057_06245 [Alphaproteobacteria bacterium]|nr:hypothetical protein [Alphaproteobacteria bacterium]
MKKLIQIFSLMIVASVGGAHATLFTEEQLEILEGTRPSPATLESAIDEASQGLEKGHYLRGFMAEHHYKGVHMTNLLVMISFGGKEKKGELALYPGHTSFSSVALQRVDYFSDTHLTAAKPLTTLGFKYVPTADDHEAYLIVERVDTFRQYQGRGFAQQAVSSFLGLVKTRSVVNLVVADCRARESRHLFAKLGFSEGADAFVQDKEHFLLPYAWRAPVLERNID